MSRPLTVLSVAYPLAPVGPDAVGGAEQVLSALDAALVRAGHCSIVIAAAGSRVAGTLIPTPLPPGPIDESVRRRSQAVHREQIVATLRQRRVDLVHLHGVDFDTYLPPAGVPVLATLHLPPAWYPEAIWSLDRPHTYLHCVSASQRGACPAAAALLPTIANGVDVEALGFRCSKRRFALALGRVCPEKNFHVSLNAGTTAGMPVLIGGKVYPYEAHERYHQEQIEPRLRGGHRFLGPIGFARKRRLLTGARCLISASTAPETSSLVAMEALACGTAVVAFPSGALGEIVEHGVTGFLVNSEREMADAIDAASRIDSAACRRAAREQFSQGRMVEQYLALYRRLAGIC